MTIMACAAGKDVYVEKPLAHTIPEGFAIIEAVRRTKRVVQVGMQRRSAELFLQAKQIMDEGRTGDMIRRQTLFYNRTRQAMITKELIEIISGAEAL